MLNLLFPKKKKKRVEILNKLEVPLETKDTFSVVVVTTHKKGERGRKRGQSTKKSTKQNEKAFFILDRLIQFLPYLWQIKI